MNMADDKKKSVDEPAADAPVVDGPVDPNPDAIEEADAATVAEKEQELHEAQKTADPNDDIEAARPDEGTPISVPAAVITVEAPDEPTVKVQLADSFKVPVLEEYEDEQGRPRGRVKGYEAPTDVRIAVAEYSDADKDFVDEDGYVALSGVVELPKHLAAQLAVSPAVEVVE